MATYTVGSGTTKTISGSTATDSVTVSGGYVTSAQLGDGADKFTISSGSGKLVYMQGGNDTVTIKGGSVGTLSLGNGNDKVTMSGGKVTTMSLYGGTNTVNISAGTITSMTGGSGTNTLLMTGGNVSLISGVMSDVCLSSGTTTVNVKGATVTKLTSDAAKGTVNLSRGTLSSLIGTTGSEIITVSGGYMDRALLGDSADKFTISEGSAKLVYMQNGNDIVTVNGGSVGTLSLGNGNDSVTMSAGTVTTMSLYAGTNTIAMTGGTVTSMTGGSGTNTITMAGGSVGLVSGVVKSIKATGGTSSVKLNGATITSMTGSAGVEKISISQGLLTDARVGDGADTFTISAGSAKLVYMQGGNDTMTIKGGSVGTLSAGSGTDVVLVSGGKISTLSLFAGSNKVAVKDGTITKILGGSGTDNITINGGSVSTVTCGKGNDIVTVDFAKVKKLVLNAGETGAMGADKLIINNAADIDFMFLDEAKTQLKIFDHSVPESCVIVHNWKDNPLSSVKVSVNYYDGIRETTYTSGDINAWTNNTYTINGDVLTITALSDNIGFSVPQNELVGVKKVVIDVPNVDLNNTVFSDFIYGMNEIMINVRDVDDKPLGKFMLESMSYGDSDVKQIVAGTQTYNLIRSKQTASFAGTANTDDYLYMGTGWNTTITNFGKGDILDMSMLKDARVIKFDATKSTNKLTLKAYYNDSNNNRVDYGTVSLSNFFKDADANNIYDGNEAKQRIKTSYMSRYGQLSGSKTPTTTWQRMYINPSTNGVTMDVKGYMKEQGERYEAQTDKSARGIFFVSGSGEDIVTAGEGRDYIMTQGGADTIYVHNRFFQNKAGYVANTGGEATKDQIFAGAGNDLIYVGDYDSAKDTSAKCNENYIDAGSGNDYIDIRGDYNTVFGGTGADEIWVRGYDNSINGGDGDDKLVYWSTGGGPNNGPVASYDNYLNGGAGNDVIYVRGNNTKQIISGGAGNDTYVVNWNKANGLTIDVAGNASTEKDSLVLVGFDKDCLSRTTYDGYAIDGKAYVYNGLMEYLEPQSINIENTDSDVEQIKSIKLLDIDAKKSYTFNATAISKIIDESLTFADVSYTTASLTTEDKSMIELLKLTSNSGM